MADEIPDEDVDNIPLDKEMVFIVKLHETLVSNFEVSPISMTLRVNPDVGPDEKEFILLYDLGYGDSLRMECIREGGNMMITLISNDREVSYSVPIDSFVDDDLMPVADEEYARLVQGWFE